MEGRDERGRLGGGGAFGGLRLSLLLLLEACSIVIFVGGTGSQPIGQVKQRRCCRVE